MPCAKPRPLRPTTGSSSWSAAAGVPRSTSNGYSRMRSRSTVRKWKLPDGWPPPTRPLTCRGTRSTWGTPKPRRGCPSTAPRTGCARSTATNPGTTSCAPKRSITVALPCTPTPRRIQGCGSDRHARHRSPFRRDRPVGEEAHEPDEQRGDEVARADGEPLLCRHQRHHGHGGNARVLESHGHDGAAHRRYPSGSSGGGGGGNQDGLP